MKAVLFAIAVGFASVALGADRFLSWSEEHKPPAGFPNPFQLSQDYPTQPPPADQTYPWEQHDFRTEPEKYMAAVLKDALTGNDIKFVNPPVGWYHAPWLHSGCGGREYIHGLTRELGSAAGVLHPNQTAFVESWAVGTYNAPGGYTLGQVWAGAEPDASKADFPRGSVAIKFLFTGATDTQVPFLKDSPHITANIYPAGQNPCRNGVPEPPRVNREMRLLQVDIAVRDTSGHSPTGWVFGTFIYSAAADENQWPHHLVPVGLMWSNDPTVKDRANEEGAFHNTSLQGSWINTTLLTQSADPKAAFVTHLGLGGRVNGPVDNPISSCLSCHAAAAQRALPLTPGGNRPSEYDVDRDFDTFFADIPPGPISAPGNRTRLDYSLQLAFGIRAFKAAQLMQPHGFAAPSPAAIEEELGPEINREAP